MTMTMLFAGVGVGVGVGVDGAFAIVPICDIASALVSQFVVAAIVFELRLWLCSSSILLQRGHGWIYMFPLGEDPDLL